MIYSLFIGARGILVQEMDWQAMGQQLGLYA